MGKRGGLKKEAWGWEGVRIDFTIRLGLEALTRQSRLSPLRAEVRNFTQHTLEVMGPRRDALRRA